MKSSKIDELLQLQHELQKHTHQQKKQLWMIISRILLILKM